MPEPNRLLTVPDDRRCSAISERTGQTCKKWAQAGSDRCAKHAVVDADSPGTVAGGNGPGPGSGSATGSDERDRALALRTARAIAKDATARDADRLTAASLLARIEEAAQAGKPPSIDRLHALSEDELQALVLAHL